MTLPIDRNAARKLLDKIAEHAAAAQRGMDQITDETELSNDLALGACHIHDELGEIWRELDNASKDRVRSEHNIGRKPALWEVGS